MKNAILASLLIAASLISSISVLASSPVSRAASSDYKWETGGKDVKVPIFNAGRFRGPLWVLVHVDLKHEKKDETGGISLVGCGSRHAIIVPRGQTIQCLVKGGGELIAESRETCVEAGTLQLINI